MIPPLLSILAWPWISLVIFKTMRLQLAILVTIIGGYLVLPTNTEIDFPIIPSLDKESVPALTALAFAALFGSGLKAANDNGTFLPRHWIVRICLIQMVVFPFLTVMTNSDAIEYSSQTIRGLEIYDAFSSILSSLIMVIPLFLAWRYLGDRNSQRLLLLVISISAVIYSFPVLIEVRMSPQINNWVYGFFPHSFMQHFRGGGWRPIVFLAHGLFLGIFLSMSVIVVVGLARIGGPSRIKFGFAAAWLIIILLISKNLGAVFVMTAIIPFIIFSGVRFQLLTATLIAVAFLTYPALRSAGFVPTSAVLSVAEMIDEDRRSSLETRLRNEDRLLDKAFERPFFGWGGWGRSRVYDGSGNDITIADGYWVILLGLDGWFGYTAKIGLIVCPILLLFLRSAKYDVGMESSILSLALAANLIDMVPNSSVTPLTWILAGSLWGRLTMIRSATATASMEATLVERGPRSHFRRGKPAARTDLQLPSDARDETGNSQYTRQRLRTSRRQQYPNKAP